MTNIFKAPPIVLSESSDFSNIKRMQILKVGDFFHDTYGNFKINEKMLSEMVRNFKDGVRGVVPALDYSHNSEDVAAGWFKDLFLNENKTELWADVDMTPKGSKVLSEKEFGYTSAEFDPDYETNEVPKKKYGAVLLGAALTNRPVIKNMKSVIELSEGGKMDIKELEEKLAGYEKKFSESEESMKKLMEAAGVDSMEAIMELISSQKPQELMEEKDKMLAEHDEELKETKKMLSEAQEKLKLAESEKTQAQKESKFTIMLSEGKVCVAQKEAFMNNDMEEFAKNAQAMNLSEKGHGNTPKDDGKDPSDKILELSNELVSTRKITLSEAIAIVRKENPELVKKLQEKK